MDTKAAFRLQRKRVQIRSQIQFLGLAVHTAFSLCPNRIWVCSDSTAVWTPVTGFRSDVNTVQNSVQCVMSSGTSCDSCPEICLEWRFLPTRQRTSQDCCFLLLLPFMTAPLLHRRSPVWRIGSCIASCDSKNPSECLERHSRTHLPRCHLKPLPQGVSIHSEKNEVICDCSHYGFSLDGLKIGFCAAVCTGLKWRDVPEFDDMFPTPSLASLVGEEATTKRTSKCVTLLDKEETSETKIIIGQRSGANYK